MRVIAMLALVMWSGVGVCENSLESKDPSKCRYVQGPVVFHVERKSENVSYDLCVGIEECDENGKKARYHLASPALTPASCPTLEEAYRLNEQRIKDNKFGTVPDVEMRPDPEEVLNEADGTRCEIVDRPGAFWERVSETRWSVSCFGTKVCTKKGKRVETIFGCPPRPETEWETQSDGRKKMFCSSLSSCLKEAYSFSETKNSNGRPRADTTRLTGTTH